MSDLKLLMFLVLIVSMVSCSKLSNIRDKLDQINDSMQQESVSSK